MLGVPTDSSAVLSIFGARELVDVQAASVVGDSDEGPISIGINRVDICSIEANGEDSHHFPTELACRCLPDHWIPEVA